MTAAFGPQSPGAVITDFVYCLLLVVALHLVVSGRRIYLLAVAGLSAVLYARIAGGFIDPSLDSFLIRIGLVVAAAVVVFDLVFEASPEA